MRCSAAAAILLCAGAARAQTMLDQEQRLIEVHALLLALQPGNAPAALDPGQVDVGVELIGIPPIDGTTGGKRQITASDRTPVFPRPRLTIGLPALDEFRAHVGLSYIPPIQVRSVSSHFIGLEAGLSYAPGPLAAGLRVHGSLAQSKSPVTDPTTRDTLDTKEVGGDLLAGYRFDFEPGSVTPFASAGISYVSGDFHVTSDDALLTSRTTNPSFTGGVRLALRPGFEAVGELVVFPGRLVHPSIRLGWVFDVFAHAPRR